MPRELFHDVVEPSITVGRRPWYAVPLSIVSHLTVLGILVAAPLLAARELPAAGRIIVFTAPAVIPEPPPPPMKLPRVEAVSRSEAVAPTAALPMLQTSLAEASTVSPLALPPPSFDERVTSTVPAFGAGSVTVLGGPPTQDRNRVIPVGGAVRAPVKIRDVMPVYPAVARAARAQGVVVLEAIIDRDGMVRDVRVVKSVPLLDQAAIAAVRSWRYTQPTLNGIPVDVSMTVRVAFTVQKAFSYEATKGCRRSRIRATSPTILR